MWVQRVRLTDFRNYEEAEAELEPGLNLVVGRNAQGKTSLLEAIYCLSALGSHRTGSSSAMVRHERDRALVQARGEVGSKEVRVEAQIGRTGGMKVWVDRQQLTRRARVRVPASVMFSPEDLALVKGAPEERRRFLDNAATLTRPLAAADRMDFERALRQRNGALRAARSNPRAAGQLDIWGEQVAMAGAAVVRNRLAVLEWLKPAVQRRYQELAAALPPELEYEPSWTGGEPVSSPERVPEALRRALERVQAADLERGTTSVGPHRDDLSISLGGADSRLYASQGEQRSLSLALRLAERDAVAGVHGEEPILLLDDVFSELDTRRRDQLAELVSTTGQTIVTATTAESVPMRGGLTLAVQAGRLSRVG